MVDRLGSCGTAIAGPQTLDTESSADGRPRSVFNDIAITKSATHSARYRNSSSRSIASSSSEERQVLATRSALAADPNRELVQELWSSTKNQRVPTSTHASGAPDQLVGQCTPNDLILVGEQFDRIGNDNAAAVSGRTLAYRFGELP